MARDPVPLPFSTGMCDDKASSSDRHSGARQDHVDPGAKLLFVIPAKAGIHLLLMNFPEQIQWIPAFAGTTETGMFDRYPCVYILASRERGTLYVGVTSDLVKRIWEHKNDLVEGFTKKYRVHHLVWYEQHKTMTTAIAREKAIKEWKRSWKIELIETTNPHWRDLYPAITENGFRLSPE
jgi:putative endonuclease